MVCPFNWTDEFRLEKAKGSTIDPTQDTESESTIPSENLILLHKQENIAFLYGMIFFFSDIICIF